MWAGNLEVLHRIDQVHTLLDKLGRNDAGTKPEGRVAHDGDTGPLHGGRSPTHGSLHRDRRDNSDSNRKVEEREDGREDSDDEVDGGNGEAESARWWLN